MKIKFVLGLLVLVLALVSGCKTNVVDPSSDDFGFDKTTLGDGGVFAVKGKKALQGYHSIFLQSVVAEPTPGMAGRSVEQSEMASLEYAYESSFRSVVGNAIPVVRAPGDHVLLVVAEVQNVALMGDSSEVMASDDASLDDATSIDGGAMDADGMTTDTGEFATGSPRIDGSSLGIGDLSISLQIRDAMTGELLATFKDNNVGDDIEAISGLTSWARVSDAFNRWNRELKTALVKATAE
ncbi:MAG: DUF3313 family protein [Puniceicoccales bacterium]